MNTKYNYYSNYAITNQVSWTVLESLCDALLIIDVKGIVTYMNRAAEEQLKLTFSFAVGKELNSLIDLNPIDLRKNLQCNDLDSVDSSRNKTPSGLFYLNNNNEKRIVSVTTTPITFENGESGSTIIIHLLDTDQVNLAALINQTKTHGEAIGHQKFNATLTESVRSVKQDNRQHALFVLGSEYSKDNEYEIDISKALISKFSKYIETILLSAIRKTDLVTKIGSFQFAVLINDCALADATNVAMRILEIARNSNPSQELKGFFEMSIGVSGIYKSISSQPSKILKNTLVAYKDALLMKGHAISVSQNNH